jgi:hypothetical protein
MAGCKGIKISYLKAKSLFTDRIHKKEMHGCLKHPCKETGKKVTLFPGISAIFYPGDSRVVVVGLPVMLRR